MVVGTGPAHRGDLAPHRPARGHERRAVHAGGRVEHGPNGSPTRAERLATALVSRMDSIVPAGASFLLAGGGDKGEQQKGPHQPTRGG